MHCSVISLFPEMFNAITEYGVVGKAVKKGLISFECINPRDYAQDARGTVDDRPYGGGPGMVMQVAPLLTAIEAAKAKQPQAQVVYLSPQGKPASHVEVQQLAQLPTILVAGRYEGIDERIIELAIDVEWSIGDYVLSGGELPAMVLIDAAARLVPGVLGDQDSAAQDSFAAGLLDCPHFTRPEEISGLHVPQVLLQGNHQAIAEWRLKQQLGRTWERRPDLLEKLQLTTQQQALLTAYIEEKGL